MNPVDGLLYGFSIALTPTNVLAALVGALLGTAVGILPGMSPTVAIALLLVPTMHVPPETGLIMLGAIYYGTQYGDSMTAILMNIPSEAPSVVIAVDGYEVTKRGRPGAALSVAATGAFIGATIGLLGLTLLAGPVADIALNFGPPEFFGITVIGLVVLSQMTSVSRWKGMMSLALGLALPTIGMDPMSGLRRFNFGMTDMMMGIDLVPTVMGLVGMAEMIHIATTAHGLPRVKALHLRDLFPTRSEWKEALPASLRGSFLGFFMGLLPGPTMTLSTFASYRLEKRVSRHPEQFGHGALAGVAGPKSADDGSVSGTLVPLMALGLPFTAVTAMLFAGLMLHGLHPGPVLITQHPEVFWGLVAAMYIGNIALLVLNFPLVGLWMSFLRIPQPVLSALLVALMLIGGFSLRDSVFDIAVLMIAGVVGYFMKQMGYERTLVILGLVLGPMLESNFVRSIQMGQGSPLIFLERPVPLGCTVLLVIVLLGPKALNVVRPVTGASLLRRTSQPTP